MVVVVVDGDGGRGRKASDDDGMRASNNMARAMYTSRPSSGGGDAMAACYIGWMREMGSRLALD